MKVRNPRPKGRPKISFLVLRTLVIAVLITLLVFAVTLFFSVATILVLNLIRGSGISPAVAYRHVAVPVAVGAFALALIFSAVMETRHYRRLRAEYIRQVRAA